MSSPTAPGLAPSLHGDLARRAVVHVADEEWTASPSGTVERKRFHRVGPLEAGQVTSLVRYLPDAKFPAHPHPEGEEILVLSGVFSDEHGDWPAGTYLLNPEGFRHAPFSREGCALFVKLRQFPGEREHLCLDTNALPWDHAARGSSGISTKPLYRDARFPETMALEHWEAGTAPGLVSYPGGVEYFVLKGSFHDEVERYHEHDWLRVPPGGHHTPVSEEGCELYVKRGGVALLRGG